MREKLLIGLCLVMLLPLALMLPMIGLTLTPPSIEWTRIYGGPYMDGGYSVVQTSDGGYTIAGFTKSFGAGERDAWLIRTDADGNMMWNKTYGGTSPDEAFSMVQTSDGGYALAGRTCSFGAGADDFWLVKTDADGNMMWNKTYGGTEGEIAWSVVQTSDGGYALAGVSYSYHWSGDFWLVKTDADGNMQWSRVYGETGYLEEAWGGLVQSIDGGYVLAGYKKHNTQEAHDMWLVKTDATGNMQWDITYGEPMVDEDADSVVQTSDGGYAITGLKQWHSWLLKIDSAGNILWDRTYGPEWVFTRTLSVVQTSDGGYALAGHISTDTWLVKTDATGNMQWNITCEGTDFDAGLSVVQTSDGGYAIAGFTNYGYMASDAWLIKVAPTTPPAITATIDIDPDTLNLKSNGEWITAYIELPEGYDVADIVLETVALDEIQAITDTTYGFVTDPDSYLTDHDGDGILERMVKFDRATVRDTLTDVIDYTEGTKFYDLTLTVTGQLADGTPFEGTDTIVVIKK